MERHRDEQVIKKGPWTAEEDEVLMNFVNKYGPKDWSSIRSMDLLPRTGKSCRLRWVNKLRPNLKIGCKFSAEEERVVIDLQARFGNKWATIASYLPGRTDNDVKNFWSTRQKRLARILQSPSSPLTNNLEKIQGKSPALVHEMPTPKAPEFSTPQMKEEPSSSSKCQSCPSSSMGNSEILQIMSLPNFMMTPNSINLDSTTMPLLDTIETDHHNKSSTQTPLQHSFTHLPFLPESHESVLGLCESNFLDVFESTRQAVELENVSQINFGSPFLELDGTGRNDGRADSFFDELPADMFDYL